MQVLADNIRFLRKSQSLSQQALADSLLLSRSNLAKYEKAVHDPGLEVLLRISRYFNISVDVLLTVDLSRVDLNSVVGQQSMVLPMQVDADGDSVVEIIPQDASAGYLGNYSDPEYIEALEHLYLPFLPKSHNCRAFPVNGDSMPPVIDGSYIVGEYVDSIQSIKIGSRYIVVSRDDGIVFKRIKALNDGFIHLSSDNPFYADFSIAGQDVVELWEFVASISIQDSSARHMEHVLVDKMSSLQQELERVKQVVGEA